MFKIKKIYSKADVENQDYDFRHLLGDNVRVLMSNKLEALKCGIGYLCTFDGVKLNLFFHQLEDDAEHGFKYMAEFEKDENLLNLLLKVSAMKTQYNFLLDSLHACIDHREKYEEVNETKD